MTCYARAKITVEFNTGSSWSDDCDLAQVYKQGEEEAIGTLRNAIHSHKDMRIIGTPEIVAIMVPRK